MKKGLINFAVKTYSASSKTSAQALKDIKEFLNEKGVYPSNRVIKQRIKRANE